MISGFDQFDDSYVFVEDYEEVKKEEEKLIHESSQKAKTGDKNWK